MSPDDRNLLLRFVKNRDQDAFGVLVRQYLGLVYHSALRRVGDAHAAEDIVQQVFTLLARKADKVCVHETLVGWLHTTTRLEVHQYLRRERRRTAHERAVSMHDDMHASDPARDWEKLQPVIDAALDRLDSSDRDAVLLRFSHNQSFAAIGEQFGVTENAARMRVDRALDKLNGILTARKITSVSLAAALATDAVAASASPALAAHVTAQALAGAALGVSGGIAATILTMTTSSKIIVASTCVLVALGLGSAIYERQQVVELRAEVAALGRKLDAAAAATEVDKTRIAALEKDLASAQRPLPPVIKSTSGPAPRAPLRYGNPEYARLQLEQFRASLPGKFGSLYRALHLSDGQIAAFEAIEVECRQELIDIWAAADAQGIAVGNDSSASTSVTRMTSDPLVLRDEKLKTLLGGDNLKLYTDYDSPKGRTAITFIPALAGDLFIAGTPLTAEQGDLLRRAIVDHTEIVKEPMASDGGKTVYRLVSQTDWKTITADAGAFLSDEQRVVLKNRTDLEVLNSQLKTMGTAPAK